MVESRRRFIRATGTALAVGAFAGCLGQDESNDDVEDVNESNGGADVDWGPVEREPLPEGHGDAQYRGGLQRRGVFHGVAVPESVTVDWTLEDVNTTDYRAAKSSPVLAPNGNVVFGSDTGEVYAVAPDGEVEWVTDTGVPKPGIHGTPAIADGTVYVGAYDGAMYAFDLDTGEQQWRTEVSGSIGASPGYYDGTIYIAVEYADPSGAMYALDAEDGSVEWDDQTPSNHPHSTSAIDLDAGYMVVGDNDGVLHGWSFPDLELEWQFQTGGAIKGPVATYDGSAFFGSWDDNVYRVALDDGTEEWAYETDDYVMSGPAVEGSTGTVYVGSHDDYLHAIDVDTGDREWAFDTGGTINGCPTVTREHVVVGSYTPQLTAVDKRSGEEVWHVDAPGLVSSTPLVTEDAIYFTTRASTEYIESDGDEGESGALYRVVADE